MAISVSMIFIPLNPQIVQTMTTTNFVHICDTVFWNIGAVCPHPKGLFQNRENLFNGRYDQAPLRVGRDSNLLSRREMVTVFVGDGNCKFGTDFCNNHLTPRRYAKIIHYDSGIAL